MDPLDFTGNDRDPEPAAPPVSPSDGGAAAAAAPTGPVPQTLADLLRHLQGWRDWSDAKRRVGASHLRTAGLIATNGKIRAEGRLDRLRRCDVVLATVPCDPKWLNAHLFRAPPMAFGINDASFSNVVATLRTSLRRVGLVDPQFAALPPEGTAWRSLLDSLQHDEHCRLGLTGFANWCHARSIPPDAVTDATLRAYGDHVSARTLHDDIPGLLRTVARSWKVAARLRTAWPQTPLQAPSRRQSYTLPFSRFPASFQDEVARYAASLSGSGRRGPFHAKGLPGTRRDSTVRTRLYQLRQAVSALVLRGRDPAGITALTMLIEPAAFETILTFYWERAIAARVARGEFPSIEAAPVEAGVTSQTGGIAVALLQVARYCKVPPEQLDELTGLAADLQPRQQGSISAKNLARLRQFDEPAMRRRLLQLSDTLMRRAETAKTCGRRTAQIALKAVAIDLLLYVPLRISNLTHLRLGEHLKFDGSRAGRVSHLVLRAHETKNAADLEWVVEPELAAFLDRYLRRFRPLLAAEGSTWLFPAPPPQDAPLAVDTLRYHIVHAIRDEVGAESNPHLFRALVTRLILEESPGALEDARHLLGDKSQATVLAHYASIEPAHAARRHAERLQQLRLGGGKTVPLPHRGTGGQGRR